MFVLLALIFLSITIAVLAIGTAIDRSSSRTRLLRDRLKAVDSAARREPSPEIQILRDELLSGIPALNKLLARWSRSSRLQLILEQAGTKLRPGKFLMVWACAAAAGACIALAFARVPYFGVLGFALGAAVPAGYIFYLRRKRFSKFEKMFPQAIELLVRSTRAGHPFTSSMELIATELSEPISGEFRQIYEEQKFGLPVRDALLNLTERVPLIDVKFFVTSLMLQRETGGNLAEILEQLAYVIRERFRILRQVRVYTAQGRLTMLILMALPPGMVLFMSVANPQFIKPLFSDPMGHFLIALALTMQTIGFFLIRKIIEIKV
jgi:tight adherence protein B